MSATNTASTTGSPTKRAVEEGPKKEEKPKAKKSRFKPGHFYRRKLPDSCIAYDTPAGVELFRSAFQSGFATCHFHLVAQFRTQDEPSYCGLGTLAMTLNALAIDPKRVWKGVWRWFDETLLDCCKPLEEVKTSGIDLEEFVCLARCNGASANLFRPIIEESAESGSCQSACCAQDTKSTGDSGCCGGSNRGGCCGSSQSEENSKHLPGSLEHFRDMVKTATSLPVDNFSHAIVISYNRRILGQSGTGHFSPIGAYDPASDSLLILDVARFKYPPHWVPLPLAYEAMKSLDSTTGRPRGWVKLSSVPPDQPRCCATSLFCNVHDLPKATAWVRRNYQLFVDWLESAEAGQKLKDVANMHATVAKFLEGDEQVEFGAMHSGGLGPNELPTQQTGAKGTCSCTSEDNHRETLQQIVADIERTELFALVQTWRQRNLVTLAQIREGARQGQLHDHVHDRTTDISSPDGSDLVTSHIADTASANAIVSLFGKEQKDDCCGMALCVGNGIGASLPLPHYELVSSRWAAHVLTIFMVAFGDHLVSGVAVTVGVPEEGKTGRNRASKLLHKLLELKAYPNSSFPEFRRELECILTRIKTLSDGTTA